MKCPGYRNVVDVLFKDQSEEVFRKLAGIPKSSTTFPAPSKVAAESTASLKVQTEAQQHARLREATDTNFEPRSAQSTSLSSGDGDFEQRQSSILETTERRLVQLDPFGTLPFWLNKSSQSFFHRTHTFLVHYTPSWGCSKFAEHTAVEFMSSKPIFCGAMAGIGGFMDVASGRELSLESLRWKSKTTSCVKDLVSDPSSRYGDDVVTGVTMLLFVDLMAESGRNSHIHSKALARLFRDRGGFGALLLSQGKDLFVCFLLIIPIRTGQISYLEYISPDVDGAEELRDWASDVELLILNLRNISLLDKSTKPSDMEERVLSVRIVDLIDPPLDEFEVVLEQYIICYLAAMQWQYRYRQKELGVLHRELLRRCRQLKGNAKLSELTWILVQGLDGDRHRKWRVIQMTRVLHRLSDELRSRVVQFLKGFLDPRARKEVSLDHTDFVRIRREALAGLPVSLIVSGVECIAE